MRKREFLKRAGLIGAGASVAVLKGPSPAGAAETDPLVGVWEMTVVGKVGTYHYIYSISSGAWVATGNYDEGFQHFKYSPTMGSYVRESNGTYRYTEKGWVFDLKGNNVGTFRSQGTFTLDAGENSLRGPGTFTQFDSKGKAVFVEPFTATASKIQV
jgi:hypothetical protein